MPSQRARQLRQTATEAERRMWSALRDRRLEKCRFRRQHPIGPFIVDFACTRYALVVEIDGSQHAENIADKRRAAFLERQGWRLIRFWNSDVFNNTNGVIETILRALQNQ